MIRERRISAIHVHTGPRGWVVRIDGRHHALRRMAWKRTAVMFGRQQARRYGVPLIVHREDGTVESIT